MQNYLCHSERSEAIANACNYFVSLRCTRNDNIQLILPKYLSDISCIKFKSSYLIANTVLLLKFDENPDFS